MNSKSHPPTDLLGLPLFWQEGVLSQVHLGENVLAWLEVDLNDELSFKKNLVILTDQRVISTDQVQKSWNFWSLSPDLSLRVLDHAGVGTLALHQGGRRLAAWRFTLGLEAAVLRWKLRFENQQHQVTQTASFLGLPIGGPDEGSVHLEPGLGFGHRRRRDGAVVAARRARRRRAGLGILRRGLGWSTSSSNCACPARGC